MQRNVRSFPPGSYSNFAKPTWIVVTSPPCASLNVTLRFTRPNRWASLRSFANPLQLSRNFWDFARIALTQMARPAKSRTARTWTASSINSLVSVTRRILHRQRALVRRLIRLAHLHSLLRHRCRPPQLQWLLPQSPRRRPRQARPAPLALHRPSRRALKQVPQYLAPS